MSILTVNTRRTGQPRGVATTSPMHPQDFMILLGKFKVDSWLLESVQARLNEILPYLLKGRDYTWQELLGEDFLADMVMPRNLATLCLKHLAALPDAALIDQSYPGCGTTSFQIV